MSWADRAPVLLSSQPGGESGPATASRCNTGLCPVSRSDWNPALDGAGCEDGSRLRLSYELAAGGRHLLLETGFESPSAADTNRWRAFGLQLQTGTGFGERSSAGFTGWVETARWTVIDGGAVRSAPAVGGWESDGDWAGLRNRFWGLLVRHPDARITVRGESLPGGYRLNLAGKPKQSFELYAGPLEPAALAGSLSGLWIAGLWDWLRIIAIGLYYLLEVLHKLIGHYGTAIVLLALAVKLLMLPLMAVANRWQRQVNVIQARLQPELQRIRREYRGEESGQTGSGAASRIRRHAVLPDQEPVWRLDPAARLHRRVRHAAAPSRPRRCRVSLDRGSGPSGSPVGTAVRVTLLRRPSESAAVSDDRHQRDRGPAERCRRPRYRRTPPAAFLAIRYGYAVLPAVLHIPGGHGPVLDLQQSVSPDRRSIVAQATTPQPENGRLFLITFASHSTSFHHA
ncbi:MAG: hypothetical protein U5P41_02425 [Gammaproteobacteria bacterium]|nr:hypothetical protein [Gammaproteobacteria bacterium]